MKKKFPSRRSAIFFINFGSWSEPYPKVWTENADDFSNLISEFNTWVILVSAPLSNPSESRKTDSTLFLYFFYLKVLNAISIPAKIEVPPLPDKLSIAFSISLIFFGATFSKGINLVPKLSNVISDIRSDSPRSSTMYDKDFLTN